MTAELFVLMGDHLAGRLTRAHGVLRLSYEQSYRQLRDSSPISVTMPLTTPEHTDRVVAPWVSGLLPDNEAVLARWSRTFHVAATPFALLGTHVGEDCAGSVRFVTEDRLADALARRGEVDWLDESGVAARLRDLQQDATAWLGRDSTGQFSLGGAQSKTALLLDKGRWGVPSGSASTSHILKPAIDGLDGHHLNEHLCLRAGQNIGLPTVKTRVLTFEDQSAIVVDRYDRSSVASGWLQRTHQEDLCQATGTPPALKYQNDGGPSSSNIAALLRLVLPPARAELAVWNLFDAMTFNWLIGGTDAHAKNYSLLLSGSQVRFAPLYDIASSLAYKDMPVQKLQLAMKFGDSYSLTHRTKNMWPRVAKELGLPADAVIARATRLAQALPDGLADAVRTAEVVALGSDLPTRLLDAVAARVIACCQATGLCSVD